jgi:type II secretory pathway component PulJ
LKSPALSIRGRRTAFTLIEVVISTAISVGVGLITIAGLVQGVHLFKCNESEI